MAITLAEAKVTMEDKVDKAVIDEFRRSSLLLDRLTFDNCVSPGTGGSTLTYGYTRLLTPSTAAGREINSEYTPNEAKRQKCSVDLKIFGGAFSVDRVIQETSGSLNEMEFQLKEKIKAARNYFHYLVINGDSEVKSTEFDGLDTILTGTSTEYTAAKGIDLSTSEATDANYGQALSRHVDA
ncbi:MAG: major capsid protein [Huintestinicola sp.]